METSLQTVVSQSLTQLKLSGASAKSVEALTYS